MLSRELLVKGIDTKRDLIKSKYCQLQNEARLDSEIRVGHQLQRLQAQIEVLLELREQIEDFAFDE